MNKIYLAILFSVVMLVFLNCSGEKKTDAGMQEIEKTQTAVADTGNATCPGCGMVMAKTDMIKHEADGKTTYFCHEQCKEHYLATVAAKTDSLPPAQHP
jgi:YHS domain-containing protein